MMGARSRRWRLWCGWCWGKDVSLERRVMKAQFFLNLRFYLNIYIIYNIYMIYIYTYLCNMYRYIVLFWGTYYSWWLCSQLRYVIWICLWIAALGRRPVWLAAAFLALVWTLEMWSIGEIWDQRQFMAVFFSFFCFFHRWWIFTNGSEWRLVFLVKMTLLFWVEKKPRDRFLF